MSQASKTIDRYDPASTISRASRGALLPCTMQQEGLWFEHQLNPESSAYHLAFALDLDGPLDVDALSRAVQALVVRHEVLRTRIISEDGIPHQEISPPPTDDVLQVCNVKAADLDAWTDEQAHEPIDLAAGPLFRARLACVDAKRHILILVLHHIVADGWSFRTLGHELSQLYSAHVKGVAARLGPLAIQPADHAVWQRKHLDRAELERHLVYWRETLADLPTIDFPSDRPRPAQPTGAGASICRILPDGLGKAARRLASARGASFLAVLHASLLTVLHRWTGQEDLPIGSVFSGRTWPEVEPLVGYFINQLVLRTTVTGTSTFEDLVERCHNKIMDAEVHQDVPFNHIVDALQYPRVTGRNPLFQIAITLQPEGTQFPDLGAQLRTNADRVGNRFAMYDLHIEFTGLAPGQVGVRADYSTELFDSRRIEQLLDHVTAALAAGVREPDCPITAIELMSPDERERVLRIANDTAVDYPQTLLHRSFEEAASRHPGAVAVVDHDCTRHTYRQLDIAANQLAHRLRADLGNSSAHGVESVGVCLNRGMGMVTALLACWKAGAAYLPLDPTLPPQRGRQLCADAQPAVIITTSDLEGSVGDTPLVLLDTDAGCLAAQPETAPEIDARSDDAAYIIYTSGSTGVPKGVVVPHRGIANRIRWMQEEYPLRPSDAVLQKTPFSFDVSTWEFFTPLISGARIVVAAPGEHGDPEYVHDLILREGVTALHFVPTMLNAFLESTTSHYPQPGPLGKVRRVFCSGEALTADTATRFIDRWPKVGLYNLYGPTEASVEVTAWSCHAGPGPVPIGTPIANTRAYILDAQLHPAPFGVPGQLYLSGTCLAHGYLNQPALTATSFVADPHTDEPGARMYATGDLACRRPDGAIDYLGRTDRQVKLYGQRIEPGEIEHILTNEPDVAQAHVRVRDNILIAYLVPTQGCDPDTQRLRQLLSERLPFYMVPTHFLVLDQLPVAPSGKLDADGLPSPAAGASTWLAASTEFEEWLAATCAELLGISRPIGMHDNFFDLGGNSLHATQLLSRVSKRFDKRVSPRQLFANPHLGSLAAVIEATEPEWDDTSPLPKTSPSPSAEDAEIARLERLLSERAELERLLAEKKAEKAARASLRTIVPVPRGETLPCTVQQEGLWFDHQMNPADTAYHIAFALELSGHLDLATLRGCLRSIVVRHEALRTRVVAVDGVPRQVVDEPPADFDLPVSEIDADDATAWASAQVDEPMNLATGPLLRVRLARIGPDRHVLAVVLQHIVGDGWSLRLLGEELSRLYTSRVTGTDPGLTPLTIQPADHAVWQRRRLDLAEVERQLDHWRERLADLPTLDFPADRPRPSQPSGAGAGVNRSLPRELGESARDYARSHHVSLLAVLHAALLTVLHRWTGQHDLPVGSVFSGRTRLEIEPLVGFFVNQLVLRTDVSGNPTFGEVVERCHETIMDATSHQDIPFGHIVESLKPTRVAGRYPLFQVSITLLTQSASLRELALEGIVTAPLQLNLATSQVDLALGVTHTPDGRFEVGINYATDLFDADRMERLIDHFAAALAGGLAHPERVAADLELMSTSERQNVLAIGNDTATVYPTTLLHKLFEEHAAARPDAVAVIDHDGRTYSYAELDTAANQLAHLLRGHLTDHDATLATVGVGLHRGINLVTALLACWKAGAAYVPLDSDLPTERLHQLCSAADPAAIITTSSLDTIDDGPPRILLDTPAEVFTTQPRTAPPSTTGPDDAAYVLYTSGSTGTPKGVVVPHRGITNRIQWMDDAYPIDASDAVLQKTPYSFDVSVWEFFWPLITGARLVIAAPYAHRDPGLLHDLIIDQQVTTVHFVPTMLNSFLDHATPHYPNPGPLARLRQIFTSGEALSTDTANRVLATWPAISLHNLYGPTEASIDVTAWTCRPSTEPTPIGTPIANHRAYVLDPALRPVPLGVAGQLFIAGPGLAHGYLNQPALTATTFITDPYSNAPGTRMYATGDLVRRRADGALDYLGRIDRQLKLHGQRLEPAEIEHVLTQHPHVAQAAVTTHNDTLIAYLVPAAHTPQPDLFALREHLAHHLPIYMIPTNFLTIDNLPLTSSGKLDFTSLPTPASTTQDRSPTTSTERWLATTCAEILSTTTPISMLDNFFDIGGNSIHATQLLSRVRARFGTNITLHQMFARPFLDDLAKLIDHNSDPGSATTVVPAASTGTTTVSSDSVVTFRTSGSRPPLFLIHPIGGSVTCYTQLAHALEDQPVHGIEDPSLHGQTSHHDFTHRAAHYAELIRSIRPDGPYLIGGWSLGGLLAHETAYHLNRPDDTTVIALDSAILTETTRHYSDLEIGAAFLGDLARAADLPLPDIDPASLQHLDRAALEELALDILIQIGIAPADLRDELQTRLLAFEGNYRAAATHRPQPGTHRIVLITAADNPTSRDTTAWRALTPDFRHYNTPGDHYTMWHDPHRSTLADILATALRTEC